MNWRALWNPEIFHGHKKGRGFFEGWYFKLVDGGENHPLAFIPGVFLGKTPGESHSFVQVLQGSPPKSYYFSFPREDFSARRDKFEVKIGNNLFTREGIDLDLKGTEGEVKGSVKFSGHSLWPRRLWSPGIMGPFSFVPFMECNHDVISFGHNLEGNLQINGKNRNFSGGQGYLEKDWGKSFPQSWVWLQSNHFSTPRTSFVASLAKIPWLGSFFPGFFAALLHEGKLTLFSTYNRSRVTELKIRENELNFNIKKPSGLELNIRGKSGGGDFLYAPSRQTMEEKGVKESITATVDLTILKKGEIIFRDRGTSAGMEISGTPEGILKTKGAGL